MARVWVRDYPNAWAQCDKYCNIAAQLEALKPSIEEGAEVKLSSIAGLTDGSGTQKGEYYNVYEDKVAEWYSNANAIKTALETALTELEQRIAAAKNQQDLWRARILLGHWEDREDEA